MIYVGFLHSLRIGNGSADRTIENSSQIPRVDTLIKVAISLGLSIKLNEEAVSGNQLAHA